jgi:hypothetical protein
MAAIGTSVRYQLLPILISYRFTPYEDPTAVNEPSIERLQ